MAGGSRGMRRLRPGRGSLRLREGSWICWEWKGSSLKGMNGMECIGRRWEEEKFLTVKRKVEAYIEDGEMAFEIGLRLWCT